MKSYSTDNVRNNPNYKRYKDTNYYVSRMGNVVRVFNNGKERIVNGYVEHRKFCFWCKGKSVILSRAMWEMFVGEIGDGYRVIHKNGYITDNRLENLKRVTIKESMKYIAGRKRSRPVRDLRTQQVYRNTGECAKALGYAEITLRKILIGKYHAKPRVSIQYDMEG